MQIQIYVYEDVGVIISNEGLEDQHLGKTDSDAVKEAFGAFWDIINEKATD